jgi:hypothetical protein
MNCQEQSVLRNESSNLRAVHDARVEPLAVRSRLSKSLGCNASMPRTADYQVGGGAANSFTQGSSPSAAR